MVIKQRRARKMKNQKNPDAVVFQLGLTEASRRMEERPACVAVRLLVLITDAMGFQQIAK
jgi:hypothetical protein